MGKTVSNRDFTDKRVYRVTSKGNNEDQAKGIGRVRSVVFHPEVNVCVGIMVHRPDAALMFHRPDQFVALDRLSIVDGDIVVDGAGDSVDKAAEKRLGINVDDCVVWSGLAVVTRDKERLGYVGETRFDLETGMVKEVVVHSGAAKDALLGRFVLPSDLIAGFKWGVGDVIVLGENGAGEEEGLRGGLVVDARAKELATQGGVAAAAGKASAVASNQVRKVKVKVKPKVEAATKAAGQATTKGLYVTGRQISRAGNMFGDFKKEFKKGLKGESK